MLRQRDQVWRVPVQFSARFHAVVNTASYRKLPTEFRTHPSWYQRPSVFFLSATAPIWLCTLSRSRYCLPHGSKFRHSRELCITPHACSRISTRPDSRAHSEIKSCAMERLWREICTRLRALRLILSCWDSHSSASATARAFVGHSKVSLYVVLMTLLSSVTAQYLSLCDIFSKVIGVLFGIRLTSLACGCSTTSTFL